MRPALKQSVLVSPVSLGFQQTPEVNCLDCFTIRETPCKEKAEPFLCRVNGQSETVQILHFVWLVLMFLPKLMNQDNL